MIYDVSSKQFQQFLKSSGRRRDGFAPSKMQSGKAQTSRPAGAASTGL